MLLPQRRRQRSVPWNQSAARRTVTAADAVVAAWPPWSWMFDLESRAAAPQQRTPPQCPTRAHRAGSGGPCAGPYRHGLSVSAAQLCGGWQRIVSQPACRSECVCHPLPTMHLLCRSRASKYAADEWLLRGCPPRFVRRTISPRAAETFIERISLGGVWRLSSRRHWPRAVTPSRQPKPARGSLGPGSLSELAGWLRLLAGWLPAHGC